jgi:hypothetical protein
MSKAERAPHEGEIEGPKGEAVSEPPAEGEAPTLLEELILAQESAEPPQLASRIDGVVVGRLLAVEAGVARVTFEGAPAGGFAARAVTPLAKEDEGSEVALLFEGGDPRRPLVMGKMVSPLAAPSPEAAADGKRVEITAKEEIVLRCGDSSITLTRAGKILIRGAYVLSRSSGVNRIQGGSVEIN